MDVSDRQDCEMNIRRIDELLSCGIFEPQNRENILHQSAFIELMICFRDLLYKTEKYAKRISFSDDIMTSEYVHDVTDAFIAVRDACCHINSFKRSFDEHKNRGSFNVMCGRGTLLRIDALELKSDYDDDIAYFYGKNRLYMKRHIIRVFEEIKSLLEPLLSNRPELLLEQTNDL